ncbi:MAG: hypothetical protein ACP5RP_00370 [Candidatus Micrarchaeia archaeon]
MQSRLQSAIEYLVTYSWAILLIAVVLAAIYELGGFNSVVYMHSVCALPASSFSCSNIRFNESGTLIVNLQQNTETVMNITAIGCGINATPTMNAITPHITLLPGQSTAVKVNCYAGNKGYKGSVGSVFNGYLAVNYTQNKMHKTVSGSLVAKVNVPGALSLP